MSVSAFQPVPSNQREHKVPSTTGLILLHHQQNSMKYFSCLTVLSLTFLPSAIRAQENPSPEEVFERMADVIAAHRSLSCDMSYRLKYFSSDDTIEFRGKVDMVRVEEDSLFQGYIRSVLGDTIEYFYDLNLIYMLSHPGNTITTYKAHEGEAFAIKGSSAGSFVYFPFLKVPDLPKLLERADSLELGQEKIDGRDYWKVIVHYPDDDMMSESNAIYWVDKENFQVVKNTYKVKFQGNYQYDEWIASNIRYDQVDEEEMKARNGDFLDQYTVTPFQRPKREEIALLAEGTVVPEFTGRRYGDNVEMKLSDSKAKLIILDFWYMSCYPCILAIPHLQSLHETYRDRGLEVWGVNAVDNSEKGKERFPKFLEHNTITYPILLVDRSVDQSYHVTGYPSLYLLNEKREVIFSQSGFSEDLESRLEEFITDYLDSEE